MKIYVLEASGLGFAFSTVEDSLADALSKLERFVRSEKLEIPESQSVNSHSTVSMNITVYPLKGNNNV